MESWLTLVAGLAILVVGGDFLVRGAVQVAMSLGVSPLVIGLTLVGFGTSTPELVASVQAALAGSPGIAYGNIVGSNIANILLILGASAVLAPLAVNSNALKRDGVVMVAVAIFFSALAALITIGLAIGVLFVVALAAYIFFAYWQERSESVEGHGAVFDKSEATQDVDPALNPQNKSKSSIVVSLGISFAGLGLVVLGGYLLVDGAVAVARSMGISETVVGLTIVAVGTSMPEFVTSVVAALRKQSDIAFGNIVGSNIYNILGIGGFTAIVSSAEIPDQIVRVDNMVMITASLVVVGMAYTGGKISRLEGAGLLVGYAGYLAWLWP